MAMNNPDGNLTGNPADNQEDSTVGHATASTNASISEQGYIFNPITNKYNILDPNNSRARGFDPNGGNQPYATHFANALKHILDNKDHKQINASFNQDDLRF
ncbi:hypothetical protein Glove_991g16 [Diversispora epigaea]|uniref:Uncharacterized protein n=1 Tax=Diversispora epigaea TaxID=1348612 RepID=A0A397FXX4_9GLOM|nr:hypothetical protein Glove_991g16 [Diversispora epigaea]